MILRIIFLFSIFINLNQGMAQSDTIPVITGLFNDTILNSDFFKSWNVIQSGIQVDEAIVEELRGFKLADVSFELVMGTWCEDSQYHAPVMIKLAEDLGIPIAIIGINREKDCPFKSSKCKNWDIEYVPTLKVMKGNEELGRIVENPSFSVEKDVLTIISK